MNVASSELGRSETHVCPVNVVKSSQLDGLQPSWESRRTEFCVECDDPEPITALHCICGVVRPGLLCTLCVDPPLELPQRGKVFIVPGTGVRNRGHLMHGMRATYQSN